MPTLVKPMSLADDAAAAHRHELDGAEGGQKCQGEQGQSLHSSLSPEHLEQVAVMGRYSNHSAQIVVVKIPRPRSHCEQVVYAIGAVRLHIGVGPEDADGAGGGAGGVAFYLRWSTPSTVGGRRYGVDAVSARVEREAIASRAANCRRRTISNGIILNIFQSRKTTRPCR